jgi:hypothetical protein
VDRAWRVHVPAPAPPAPASRPFASRTRPSSAPGAGAGTGAARGPCPIPLPLLPLGRCPGRRIAAAARRWRLRSTVGSRPPCIRDRRWCVGGAGGSRSSPTMYVAATTGATVVGTQGREGKRAGQGEALWGPPRYAGRERGAGGEREKEGSGTLKSRNPMLWRLAQRSCDHIASN